MTSIKIDSCFDKYKNWQHVYCSVCGKSSYFKTNRKAICNHCGNIVYPSKKLEFKDKIMKELKKYE